MATTERDGDVHIASLVEGLAKLIGGDRVGEVADVDAVRRGGFSSLTANLVVVA